jgi:hypothetical protein
MEENKVTKKQGEAEENKEDWPTAKKANIVLSLLGGESIQVLSRKWAVTVETLRR